MLALSAAQHGITAVFTAAFHPIGYAKVLIQVGHEPIPPIPCRTIFGKERLCYPNVFNYIKCIKSADGFLGLYRGVVPRIVGGIVGHHIQAHAQEMLRSLHHNEEKDIDPEADEFVEWLKTFFRETGEETLARCIGIIASQPFHVIMLRNMVQFVGRETQYKSIFSSVGEIYRNEGFSGFFAGIVPRLIGEIMTVWMTSFLVHLINKYIVQEKELKTYTAPACGLVVTQFTYPFLLVSNIMAVSGSGLTAASFPNMPSYPSWMECWSHLSKIGELKRGSSLFFRYYNGPGFHTF